MSQPPPAEDDRPLVHPEICSGCSPDQGAPSTQYRRTGPDSILGQICFAARHQGWPGVAHGGQVALVLDDAFGYLSTCLGVSAVTAHMAIDFRRPAPVGTALRVTGEVLSRTARKLQYHVTLHDGEHLIAEARSISIPVSSEEWNSLSIPSPEGTTETSSRNGRKNHD